MLGKSLFNAEIVEKSENRYLFRVSFDPGHEVFKGHFPGRPVVPGVLLMETVKKCFENAESFYGKTIHSGDLKFMNPVIPGSFLMIDLLFLHDSSGIFKIKSRGYSDKTTFFKINFELW